MNDSVKYWIDLADYDLDAAKVMLGGKKYLYVAFMCHQTIEKALKAIVAKNCEEGEIPPKIHHLLKLADKAGLFNRMTQAQQAFLKRLNPMNIEARYPEYKEQIAAALSTDICKELIVETEELLCWIKQQS